MLKRKRWFFDGCEAYCFFVPTVGLADALASAAGGSAASPCLQFHATTASPSEKHAAPRRTPLPTAMRRCGKRRLPFSTCEACPP